MGSTPMEMAISYANMCKYYELCIPGLETKNPHFKSSLHLFKKEQSPVVIDNANNLPVASALTSQNTTPVVTNSPFVNNQDNQSIPTTSGGGGRNLKLLFKGKKDNKIHVKCSCNDITDGSAIKRKFLIKCNKCQAMVHGKCHNLNAQLFNNGNNHPTTWYCSMCTVDIQNDARKTAMVEDIKRAIQSSPSSSGSSQPLTKTAGTTTNASKIKQNKKETTNNNNNKEKNNANRSTSTKTKHKDGPKKNENSSEKRDKNEDKNKERKGKNTKDSKKNLKRNSSLISNSNSQSKSTCKKARYVPIQPKQTYSTVV